VAVAGDGAWATTISEMNGTCIQVFVPRIAWAADESFASMRLRITIE
jgi:hypothetical protein